MAVNSLEEGLRQAILQKNIPLLGTGCLLGVQLGFSLFTSVPHRTLTED